MIVCGAHGHDGRARDFEELDGWRTILDRGREFSYAAFRCTPKVAGADFLSVRNAECLDKVCPRWASKPGRPDLHDYNDYHWGRQQLFENLHSEICAGRYSPLRSTPIRVEKKLGVTRTLVLPDPLDCVVLQCIVEDILPGALKKQPSKNSFFSRSHGFKAPTWTFEKDYIWFKRWAEFSKIRFGIVSVHQYICTTDVANYVDNIDYTHLRNMFSIIDGVEEVTLDILFLVLDKISWRPDYLPPPGRSLPQVHFDAPRLLAHVYLYEVDEFLKKETGK